MVDWLITFGASFAFIFLKSYQTQVIVGGHYRTAFTVSALLSGVQVLTVTLIVTNGWETLVPLALGGSIGVVLAMKLYNTQHKGEYP